MTTQKQQNGFTIIEVVLVLAIAALIFLMVFIALPALQRTQRDSGRKQDIGTVASAASDYTTNHNGTPPTASGALDNYVTKMSEYETIKIQGNIGAGATEEGPTDDTVVDVWAHATCNTDGTAAIRGTSKQTAVLGLLESGDVYCKSV